MPSLPFDIYGQLVKNAALRSPEQVEAFEDALAQAAALDDPDVIPAVLGILDDATEFPEVMYGVVHLVEDFPDVEYLPRLVAAAPELIAHAPGWAETLHKGILNADDARASYARILCEQSPQVRAAVNAFLDDLRTRKPQFDAKCRDVLAAQRDPLADPVLGVAACPVRDA